MLSQVCCRKMITFCRFKDERMACRNNFQNRRIFSKKCSIESLKKPSFHYVCHDICYHKEAFQKPVRQCHDYLPFFLPSLSVIHARVYFFTALYIITSCMSTFLSRTQFPHFQFIFFLLNKTIQLPFHDYIALLFLPLKLFDPHIFSSIVLPLIMYNSC